MSKIASIVGSALPRAQRMLTGKAPFVPRTIWAVNVPNAAQAALRGMTEFTFRFLPDDEPLEERRGRIMASERPCIAIWGDGVPPDFNEFVADTGIATARLRPAAPMAQQAPDNTTIVSYGIAFEMPGSSSRNLPAVPREVIRQALDTYIATGSSEANHGRLGAKPYQPAGPAVLVVADPPNRIAPRLPERFAAYRTMLSQTRARHPGREVVFVTNDDHELPPEVIADIRRHADTVIAGPYDPALLPRFEAVVTHTSWAAFDALARGLPAQVHGPSPLAGLKPGADALFDVFAARFLQRVCYLDPTVGRAIDLPTALQLIATRCGESAGPETVISPAAQMMLSSKAPPQASRFSNRDRIVPSRADAPDPAMVTGTLRLPDWVAPQDMLPRVDDAATVCLRADIAAAPRELLALARQWHVVEVDASPARPTSAARVADFAHAQPELFGRLVRQRVSRAEEASHAILVDLANPATRAFARACERAGLTRVYVPPAPFGPDQGWGALPPLNMATTLVDAVLAWDESHLDALRDAGYPADRILPVSLMPPVPPPAAREPLILVDLALPWARQDSETPDTLDDFAAMLVGLGETFGHRVRFYLSREVAEAISDQAIGRILMSDFGSVEVEDTEESPISAELRTAALLVSDRPQPVHRARLSGVGTILIDHAAPDGTATERVRTAIIDWIDAAPALPSPRPIKGAPPAEKVLAQIFEGEIALRPIGSPKSMVMERGGLPINLVTSSVSPDVLEQAERYELAMLGARHWTRVTANTPLSDLADVDLFLQWGVRENPLNMTVGACRRRLDRDMLIIEDGFIRSVPIGLAGEPTLSLVLDDMTAFYDSTRPSRLETILNGALDLSKAELIRARAAIRLITSQKVSKYNFAPYLNVEVGRPGQKKILVVDQREGDQSIVSGLATPDSFRRMVKAALALTPEYDVIVKTHPDANIAGRGSAIGRVLMERLRRNPHVTIVTQDMNPYSLIDIVDKVFVVTSGMGMEALLAEKEVTCFGVPFYAGWGLTRDKAKAPKRRTAKRITEELFHVFYILLSRYFDPDAQRVCEIEDVIRHIVAARPWKMPPPGTPPVALKTPDRSALPQSSSTAATARPAKMPGYRLGSTIWLIGVRQDDRAAFEQLFKGWDHRIAGSGSTVDRIAPLIRQSVTPIVIDCGNAMPGLAAFCRRWDIPVYTPGELPVELPPELDRFRKPEAPAS